MVDDPRKLVQEMFGSYNELGPIGFMDELVERDALAPDFMMEIQQDAPNGGQWHGPEGFKEMAGIYTVEFSEGRFRRIGLFADRPQAERYLAGEGA